jgi:hypothetical protein
MFALDDEAYVERDMAVWEPFYNVDRPNGAHAGNTPYESPEGENTLVNSRVPGRLERTAEGRKNPR